MEKHVIQLAVRDIGSDSDDLKQTFIPRISLSPSDPQIPVQFKRHQFPIRVAFAMTINKSQGQTPERVGVYLPGTAFGHGQLYVAFSRGWDFSNITMFTKEAEDQKERGGVYTKNEIYQEMLTSVASVAVENVLTDTQLRVLTDTAALQLTVMAAARQQADARQQSRRQVLCADAAGPAAAAAVHQHERVPPLRGPEMPVHGDALGVPAPALLPELQGHGPRHLAVQQPEWPD